MNETINQLHKRVSVRAFEDKAIPADIKDEILNCAFQAPLVLIFLADCHRWNDAYTYAGADPRKPQAGDFLLACQDAVIAAQNAVVAAQRGYI